MKYFHLTRYGIEWSPYKWKDGVEYSYYFYFVPQYLSPDVRYLGYEYMWYDGPHHSFGFWWFNISWNVGLFRICRWIRGK